MTGDLSRVSEDELLNFVSLILSRPGSLTAFDKTELKQIDVEFERRLITAEFRCICDCITTR